MCPNAERERLEPEECVLCMTPFLLSGGPSARSSDAGSQGWFRSARVAVLRPVSAGQSFQWQRFPEPPMFR